MDLHHAGSPLHGAPQAMRLPRFGPSDAKILRLLTFGDSLTLAPILPHVDARLEPPAPFQPYALATAACLAQGTAASSQRRVECLAVGAVGVTARALAAQMDDIDVTDKLGRRGVGLRRLLADEAPDLALIMAGTNDLTRERTALDIFRAVEQLHMECHGHNVPTVMLSLPPLCGPAAESTLLEKKRAVNALLEEWSRSQLDVTYIDTEKIFPEQHLAHHFEVDGVHFSEEGSHALGLGIARELLLSSQMGICDMYHDVDNTYEIVD